MSLRICLEARAVHEDEEFVREQLLAFNIRHAGEPGRSKVSIFLRDENDRIVGGLLGGIRWDFLYVDKLWLDDGLRGGGWGAKLLSAAEEHARSLGCTDCVLETFSFQARPFYEKQGYRVYGILEGYPAGHDMYFLRKSLCGE